MINRRNFLYGVAATPVALLPTQELATPIEKISSSKDWIELYHDELLLKAAAAETDCPGSLCFKAKYMNSYITKLRSENPNSKIRLILREYPKRDINSVNISLSYGSDEILVRKKGKKDIYLKRRV